MAALSHPQVPPPDSAPFEHSHSGLADTSPATCINCLYPAGKFSKPALISSGFVIGFVSAMSNLLSPSLLAIVAHAW
jgi:hypothetical protein